MATIIKAERIPPINPIRFIPMNDSLKATINTWGPDRGFFHEHRREWQYGDFYQLKRHVDDELTIYIDTLASELYIRLFDENGNRVPWSLDAVGLTGTSVPGNTYDFGGAISVFQSIYNTIRLSDAYAMAPSQQILYIGLECVYISEGDDDSRWYISEPIFFRKDGWPETMLIEATHPINKFGVLFEQFPTYRHPSSSRIGVWFHYRVEADMTEDPQPGFIDTAFLDQGDEVRTLDSQPFDLYDFVVGGFAGVPKYAIRSANRALSCKTFLIDGIQYSKDTGAAWTMIAVPNYNMYSAKIRLQQYDHDSTCLYGMVPDGPPFKIHDEVEDDVED